MIERHLRRHQLFNFVFSLCHPCGGVVCPCDVLLPHRGDLLLVNGDGTILQRFFYDSIPIHGIDLGILYLKVFIALRLLDNKFSLHRGDPLLVYRTIKCNLRGRLYRLGYCGGRCVRKKLRIN